MVRPHFVGDKKLKLLLNAGKWRRLRSLRDQFKNGGSTEPAKKGKFEFVHIAWALNCITFSSFLEHYIVQKLKICYWIAVVDRKAEQRISIIARIFGK